MQTNTWRAALETITSITASLTSTRPRLLATGSTCSWNVGCFAAKMVSPRRSPRTSQSSPRRSPRLSREAEKTLGGMQERTDLRREKQESPLIRKQNAMTSARRSLSPSKHRISASAGPSHEPLTLQKTSTRRAYSIGGARHAHLSQSSRAQDASVPSSRQDVPLPRKSAIRTGPPQVFTSPTDLSPPPGVRPLAARLSNGIEAIGGPDLINIMETIGILRSPKGKGKAAEQGQDTQRGAPRQSEPAPRVARNTSMTSLVEDDATILRKKRRVTFNPFQENANFEKDEPTIHIYPTGEAIPLPETSVSTNNESSDMSLASTSSTSTGEGNDSSDSASGDEQDRTGDLPDESIAEGSEDEIEKEMNDTENAGSSRTKHMQSATQRATDDQSAMDMTTAVGGSENADTTRASEIEDRTYSDMDLEDSAMDLDGTSLNGDSDQTMTMDLTRAYRERTGAQSAILSRLSHLRSLSDEEDESSIDQDLLSLPRLSSPAPADTSQPRETKDKHSYACQDVDDGSSAMDLTDIADSHSSPQRTSSSPYKPQSSTSSPRRSPRKSTFRIDSSRTDEHPPKYSDMEAKKSETTQEAQERSPSHASRPSTAKVQDVVPKVEEDVFSVNLVSPLRLPESERLAPPKTASKESNNNSSPKSPRRTLHEVSLNSSPKLGHEFCKLPASEVPRARLSAATLKMQARRDAKIAESPSKSTATPRKSPAKQATSTIGRVSLPASKSPFKLPSASQSLSPQRPKGTESDPQDASVKIAKHFDTTEKSYATQETSLQPRYHDRQAPVSPRRRPSSPLRPPGSPSRTWQSFRRSQSPTTPKSPARRIQLPGLQSLSNQAQNVTFGTPQRVRPSTAGEKSTSTRNLSTTVKTTAGRRPAETSAAENSAVTVAKPGDTAERLTMKAFFEMLNMGFLELAAPTKRRIDYSASESSIVSSSTIARAACACVPALDRLLDACRELRASVEDGRQMLTDHEREFVESPPSYVAEVLAIESPADRQKAIASFKMQKSAARAIAQKAYYGWRTDKQFDDEAFKQIVSIHSKLREDLRTSQEHLSVLDGEALPCLRQHHAELTKKLRSARARQRSIEGCNSEEVRAMHAAMEEQGSILRQKRMAHAEVGDQLARMRARLQELSRKRKSAEDAIAELRASSRSAGDSTRGEASRLARNIGHIESLHLWSLHKAHANRLHLVLDRRVNIVLEMKSADDASSRMPADMANQVIVKSARIHALQGEQCTAAGQLAVSLLQELFDAHAHATRPSEIIRLVTTTWARARHIDDMVAQLELHFPTRIETVAWTEEGTHGSKQVPGFAICIHALFPRHRSKVQLRLLSRASTMLDPCTALFALDDVEVECIYGRRNDLAQSIIATLRKLALRRHGASHNALCADMVTQAIEAVSVRV